MTQNLKFKIENMLIFNPRIKRTYKIKKELLGRFEPVRLFTKDFVKLYAWYIKPEENMPVVLFCPGQSESISKWQDTAIALKNAGYGVLLLSYRGHYKSAGTPTEQGIYTDAKTAIEFIKKRGCKTKNIIVWGRSLGSTVACEMALRHKIKAIVLESSIADIKSATESMAHFYLKKLRFKAFSNHIESLFKKLDFTQKFENDKKLPHIKCPVYIVHSKLDEKISYKTAQHLNSINPKSTLYICDTGNHEYNDWCLDNIIKFLDSISIKPEKMT